MTFDLSEKSRPKGRLPLLLSLVALVVIGLLGWREYRSPRRAWQRSIRDPNPLVRREAWTRLRLDREIPGLDPTGTAREVAALMDDPDPELRGLAVSTLPSVDDDPLDAISRLAARSGDRDVSVRVKAATALAESFHRGGSGHDEVSAALSIAVRDREAEVRIAAVGALGQVIYEAGNSVDPLRGGRGDDPALGLVSPMLNDPDQAVRVEAAYVLACNGRGDEAVPMLTKLVRAQSSTGPPGHDADRAFLGLMILAAHFDEAAAFLDAEIAEPREGYPQRPREALAWASRQDSAARLRVKRLAEQAIRSEVPSIAHNAALLLHAMGLDKDAMAQLIDGLKDESAEIRMEVVEALADVGTADPLVVPALEAASKDGNAQVRERALAAIEAIEWDEILSGMGDAP